MGREGTGKELLRAVRRSAKVCEEKQAEIAEEAEGRAKRQPGLSGAVFRLPVRRRPALTKALTHP